MDEEQSLSERFDRARERKEPLLFIVNDKCDVVYETQENSLELLLEFRPEPGTLRADIQKAALGIIRSWSIPDEPTARLAFVAPGHVMRMRRLTGSTRTLYALSLEPFRNRDTLRVAARRYALTRREHEILVLILEGAGAPEISVALHISEHTVQGYFKRLLQKTGARNRAAMVASVLDWNLGGRKKTRVPKPSIETTASERKA